MCRFIETICIENGQVLNLPRHQQRMNATRTCFFGPLPALRLEDYIRQPNNENGRIRCRVTYGQEVLDVAYFTYQVRPIQSLKLVEGDETDYRYKYADRSVLEALFAQRGEADDILIVRDGFVTDISIANIALWDGERWYTPARPLLPGTRRAELLEQGILTEKDIPVDTIWQYQKVSLLNAMLHFGEIELPCTRIWR